MSLVQMQEKTPRKESILGLSQYKHEIEKHLYDLLQRDETGLLKEVKPEGGKCLRGAIVLIISKLADSNSPNNARLRYNLALDAAASVEILHWASLIHDDVLDQAETRRNRKSLHIHFAESLSCNEQSSSQFQGEYRAVNFSNYLLLLLGKELYQRYLRSDSNPYETVMSQKQLVKTIGQGSYADVLLRLCQGVSVELQSRRRYYCSLRNYFYIIRNKTALLFAYAAKTGSNIAQMPKDCEKYLYRFGLTFGMAFQINDDVLDYILFDSKDRGKPVAHDLSQGELTLPAIYILRRPWQFWSLRRRLLLALKQENQQGLEELVREIAKSKALDLAVHQHNKYLAQAQKYLDKLEIALKKSQQTQQCLSKLQSMCHWLEQQLRENSK